MGQRHQIFLKIYNPVKNERLFNGHGELKKARKAFGDGIYTVIALHHQWLYGHSAAVNILNMVLYTNLETASDYNNPFAKDYIGVHNEPDTLKEYINDVMNMLTIQVSPLHPRGIGFERMLFLNEMEPEMREYCNIGDNNDGITIIDTITRKYCMMNIYDTDENEVNGIYSLPKLLPVSAREYMKAYYPEDVKYLNEYDKERYPTKKKMLEYIMKNKKENEIIDQEIKLKTTGVLTLEEVKEMFPLVYKKYQVK